MKRESLDNREEEDEVEEAAAETWYHPQTCAHYFDLVRRDGVKEGAKGWLFCLQASVVLGKMVDSYFSSNMFLQWLRLSKPAALQILRLNRNRGRFPYCQPNL